MDLCFVNIEKLIALKRRPKIWVEFVGEEVHEHGSVTRHFLVNGTYPSKIFSVDRNETVETDSKLLKEIVERSVANNSHWAKKFL